MAARYRGNGGPQRARAHRGAASLPGDDGDAARSAGPAGWLPRRQGGNIDGKELVAGSTLYLPVAVPGGLVSVGDGHAAQGDGEVAGTAIECPMERVDLRYVIHDDLRIGVPRRPPDG